jgi:hypothetical protein
MIATMSVINRHTNISTQPLTASRIGNILSKTGLGSYTYGSSKPHAVTGVENTIGIIPQTPQSVTYNAFGKMSRIESGGYTLDIDYGSDRQRWRSTVTGITRWDLLLNSCVGHASRALWCAGVPNIYLFHPHLLYTQLLIRQLGIYSTPFIYHINHLNQ